LDKPFNWHPRFASGALFSASCCGALLATAYYIPGTTEVTSALVNGLASSQHTFPWQVSVPATYVGQRFESLAETFWRGWPLVGPNAPCAIPIGLYRTTSSDDEIAYVVSNPDGSTVLHELDLVIVLGTKEFGEECYRIGILMEFFAGCAHCEDGQNDDDKGSVDC